MPKRILPLTDLQVKTAKPKAKEYKLTDGGGLYLLITPSGGKLWRFNYRFDEKYKTLFLKSYPEITLSDARKAPTIPKNKRKTSPKKMISASKDAKKLLKKLEIDPKTKTKVLSPEQANKLRDEMEKKYKVEGELKHEVKMNVKRLKEIGSYRGSRHQKGLPVHGQRTKTNSRTVRGNVRRTMASGRRTESKT